MSDRQHPIDSPFDAFGTAADVLAGIDLSGKTAIVTVGYSGLGLESVRALAGAGARVVVSARDMAKQQRRPQTWLASTSSRWISSMRDP